MYRADMGVPPMPDEGAPGPMSRANRMGKRNIDPRSKVTPEDFRKLNPVLEPVPGEEVGMEERKSKVYKKMEKMSAGGYTKAADGCVQRGKTRGKFV